MSYQDDPGSAVWRKGAALRHRDRVREISFRGSGVSLGNFFRATKYHFPALESLEIRTLRGHNLDIPATFLRGPDQSDLRLRRLKFYGTSLASVSGLLSTPTALTDLTFDFTSNATNLDPSQGTFLLDRLQGMRCLRSLNLATPEYFRYSQHPTRKDIVPLLKLTHFQYSGSTIFLNNFMSRLSAPSLQDVRIILYISFPVLYLSRVIDDVREEFRSVSVTFNIGQFRLSSWAHLGKIDHFEPSFTLNVNRFTDPIQSINSTPSTKLAMAEELALFFPCLDMANLEAFFPLREFLRQFRSVRVFRVDPFMREVGHYLQQDDGEAIFPALEEIELLISRLKGHSDEEHQRRAAEELAAFEPFVSARERAGRLLKVYHCERTPSKY